MADDILNAADDILASDERMAVLTVALDGELGESPDTIPFDASDEEIKRWATEAISGGTIPGIDAQEVDFTNYTVRRLPAKDGLPDRVFVRPKTEVGGPAHLEVKCKVPVFREEGVDVRYIEVNTDPVRRHPDGPIQVQIVIGDQSVVVKADSLAAALANAVNC